MNVDIDPLIGETDSRKRKRFICNANERNGAEKRGRANVDTLAQTTARSGGTDQTMPSQRTPSANFDPAKAVGASAYAESTSLNVHEKRANIRLQHHEGTPSVRGPDPAMSHTSTRENDVGPADARIQALASYQATPYLTTLGQQAEIGEETDTQPLWTGSRADTARGQTGDSTVALPFNQFNYAGAIGEDYYWPEAWLNDFAGR